MSDKLEQFRILFNNNVLQDSNTEKSCRVDEKEYFREKYFLIYDHGIRFYSIRINRNLKLYSTLCNNPIPQWLESLVDLCVEYLNYNGVYTDYKFIQFLYTCRIKFNSLKIDWKELSMSITIDNKTYTWAFSDRKTVGEFPLITSDTPSIVNDITHLCAKYTYDWKMSKGAPQSIAVETTAVPKGTRVERVDDAIEEAIYDMLKQKPLDVDAIVKLRSLLK